MNTKKPYRSGVAALFAVAARGCNHAHTRDVDGKTICQDCGEQVAPLLCNAESCEHEDVVDFSGRRICLGCGSEVD